MCMKKRIIYIAAPWAHRDEAKIMADVLRADGHTINSRWLTEHADIPVDAPNRRAALHEQATCDAEDVLSSNLFVYVNSLLSEGKATELGFALMSGVEIALIGERGPNIFLNLNFPAYATFEAFRDALLADMES